MEPILHQLYSFDEAITAFGNDVLPEFYCHNDFVVLPNAVICLVTIGDPVAESALSSPSSVEWKRADYRKWLPEMVTAVVDRDQFKVRKIKDHHIFLRMPDDSSYFYAGPAHLGSFGGQNYSANFYLDSKLPRETWLRYGGYSGWLLEANHVIHRVPIGDLGEFRRITNDLPHQEFSHLSLTRYEEDSLSLYLNRHRGWLMYLREPADSGLYTHDVAYSGVPTSEEVFRCGCGIDLEFPARNTLPRNRAMEIAEEFFVTSELPRSVPWGEQSGDEE